MASNVVDRKDLQDWIDAQMKGASERVMSKGTSEETTEYERGKYSLAKQLKLDFKL